MPEDAWIAFANAFAGVYAATLWAFFGVMRLRSRQWRWAFVDVAMVACAAVAGVAYFWLAVDPPRAHPWFDLLRLLVVPILVLPTVVHLSVWRRTRAFLHRAEEVGDSVME